MLLCRVQIPTKHIESAAALSISFIKPRPFKLLTIESGVTVAPEIILEKPVGTVGVLSNNGAIKLATKLHAETCALWYCI